jgi:23S rRNA (cytosine1962-C5)-methyltransferase
VQADVINFKENNCLYHVRPGGQKTGYYLDQKYNRSRVADYIQPDMQALDAFCFSGGFTLPLLKKGAHVTALDSSSEALDLLRQNIHLNSNIPNAKYLLEKGDVFSMLRKYKQEGRQFDLIVQDPPRMSPHKQDQKKAMTAYKDLFLHSIFLLKSPGLLAGFSCSYHINLQTLKETLAWAAMDAGREARVIEIFSQAPDHPVPVSFPEAEYLSGFLAVMD